VTVDSTVSGAIGAVLGSIGGAIGAFYGLKTAVALNRQEMKHLRETLRDFAKNFGQHVERLDNTLQGMDDRLWSLTGRPERRRSPRD